MADFYHDALLNLTNHHHGLVSMLDPNHATNHSIIGPGSSPAPPDLVERDCFNATELEAVPSRWGQLFLIVLYTLTSLLALIGNVTVIVVEICGNESAHNIRKYLINLAISDIIIGVLCVPFTYTDFMLGQWIFPHVLCPLTQMVQLLSVFVTSLTLTFIGIERYLATLHPFSSLHHWLESHTHIMLALTWVFGACYAYIPFENTATRPFKLPTDNQTTYYECSYDNDVSIFKRRLFMTLNILLTFILPLFVLIFSYSAIMRKLIHDERRFRHSSQHAYGIKFKNTTNTNTNTNAQSPTNLTNQSSSADGSENGNVANNSSNNNNNNNTKDNNAAVAGSGTMVLNDNSHKCDCSVSEKLSKPKKWISSSSLKRNDFPAKTTTTNELPLSSSSSPEAEIIRPSIIDISDNNNNNNNNNNSNQKSILKSSNHQQQQLKLDQATTTSHNNNTNNNSQLNTSNIDLRKSTPFNYRSKVRKTIKMMFTVILLYGICWMPIKLYQFLMDFGLIAYCTETELYAMVCLYFICHWMAMANSFVNPIIYSFMSKSFRNDFRKITQTFRQTLSKNLNQLSIKTTSTQV